MFALGTVFLTSFILALSGAMMPGPLLTATISETVRRGARTGPLLILGHSLLELVMLAALLIGLAPLLRRDLAFAMLALAGAGILAWMAIGMLRALPTITIHWDVQPTRTGPLVSTGILMSLANPYWTIWWATIGLGYLTACRALGTAGIAAFFVGHIAGDFAWYTFIAVLVARGRRLLTNRVYRCLIGLCALFLVGFACYFAYVGVDRIAG